MTASWLQRVSPCVFQVVSSFDSPNGQSYSCFFEEPRGKKYIAMSESELKIGRINAANDDTKFISQEAEWFLAGVLDGIADGISNYFFSFAPVIPHS